MDAGNLDAAEVAFAEARKLVEGGDSETANVLLDINRGELSLRLEEIPQTQECFERVLSQDPASLPPHLYLIADAGLGICELHEGQLRRAVNRHDVMKFPSRWSFDPSLPVTFQARIRRCHGDLAGALNVLRATAEEVEARFPVSWIKLRMEEIRISRAGDEAAAKRLAQDVSERAARLGLTHQCKRIQALV